MTPQLRQAIKLLEFSNQDVAAFVEEELARNPLLEVDDRPDAPAERPALDQRPAGAATAADTAQLVAASTLPGDAAAPLDADWSNSFDAGAASDGVFPTGDGAFGRGRGGAHDFDADGRGAEELAESRPSLREQLAQQLRLAFADPGDRLIAGQFLALLDAAGRVAVSDQVIAAALAVDEARVAAVRARMQRFEPTGLFSRGLRDCLAAQLAERNRLDPAMQALLDNLELLARRDLRRLQALCGVDAADLAEMIAEVRRLDPKPGTALDQVPAQTLVPDVLMRALPDGVWHLELNPDSLPRVLVNQAFYARVAANGGRDARAFLSERMGAANWLVKSLQQRAQTILKVASEIVRQQDGFFRHGVGHLRPLILRDVAGEVEMHESTVSRVTANKYIATPRGTFELRYFFTTAINGLDGDTHSAEAVRHRIRALVDAEPANDVLSDDAIVALLRREGVDIARRTVAKYRDALRIPSSVQRKREKAVPA